MNELFPNPADLFARISEATGQILAGSGIDLAIKGVIAYLFAVWVAFVIWVARDITNRTENLLVQTFSVLLVVVFTPVFGIPIYLLVRPRATLFERYYEEANLQEAEEFFEHSCPECTDPVSEGYRYCPHCGTELLRPCPHCGELVGKSWEHCAYCGRSMTVAEKTEAEEPAAATAKAKTKVISKKKTPKLPEPLSIGSEGS
jgi:hypothetical protein